MLNTACRRDNWLPLLGVGVAIGLPVRDSAVLAPSGAALQVYELRGQLVRALHVPVVVDNDATVLAVRETYGQNVRRDFAFVLVAEDGVRAAVAIDGRVRRGAEGMAGAIGDIAVARPGRGDCTADTVRSRAAVGRIRGDLASRGTGLGDLTGDAARRVLDDAGEALGQGLFALMRVVDPDQIRIVIPTALNSGPGRRYRDRAEAVLGASYTTRGQSNDVNLDVVSADVPRQCARAAAIRVVVEFIDHMSGIDGCPPADRSVPSWLASGRTAVVGGALGAAMAPTVPVVPLIPVVAAAAYAGARHARRRRNRG